MIVWRPQQARLRWEETVPKYLCKACGTQHPERPSPPERCQICEDERQFVPATGQEWLTSDALAAGRSNAFREVVPGLFGISTVPQFAIGQRALLVVTPDGNILWDCVSLLDSATIAIVSALGGLKAIALSHPHFYSAMATWGRTFDCPVFVHEADRKWLAEPDPHIQFWAGETRDISPDVTPITFPWRPQTSNVSEGGWPRSISTRSIRRSGAAAISSGMPRPRSSGRSRATSGGMAGRQKRRRRKPRGLPRRHWRPGLDLNQDIERCTALAWKLPPPGRAHHRRSRGYEPSPGPGRPSINPNRPGPAEAPRRDGPRTSCATDCARC